MKARFLCRLMTASHGAVERADATTDPRPRVTKRIGNAQQTSVVNDESSPNRLLARSARIMPPSAKTEIRGTPKEGSDQENRAEEVRWLLGSKVDVDWQPAGGTGRG